jgi:CRISPR-associated endonuclease/helicase Cas3
MIDDHDALLIEKQYEWCQQGLESEHEKIELTEYDEEKTNRFLLKSRKYIKKQKSDHWFFALQFFFSKLISADKLDSAGLIDAGQKQDAGLNDVHDYLIKKSGGKSQKIDDKRSAICKTVLDKIRSLSDNEIRQKRIFTLTAPTGTGKTLTSISAAILLGKRIEKIEGYKPRIITALPFINILEQTKDDYKGIFHDVLIHYGSCEMDMGNKNLPLNNRLLLTEAWESNVIITTFVQLFESILSGENKKVLKINKLCGAIVILDEVQALPAKYYPLLGAVIQRFSQYYGTRFILMTATQPEIVTYANKLLPDHSMKATELLENSAKYYHELKRTMLIPVLGKKTDSSALLDLIKDTKKPEQAALVVVNTIAHSIEVYNLLKENFPEENIIYLSTNLTGKDRQNVISNAKHMLEYKQHFIMVSTQTIEAGVDLDFDIAYRDLAPLESIIQIAGRVNRVGKKGNYCPVYIFDSGNANKIYKMTVLKKSQSWLSKSYKEPEYYGLMKTYYKDLAESDLNYDTDVYYGILELDYDKINKFKMIEETERVPVIIIQDEHIQDVLEKFCGLIKNGNYTFEAKAKLKQLESEINFYCVEIYPNKFEKNSPIYFKDLYGIDLNYFVVPQTELNNYYGETGFISENGSAFLY